MVMFFDFVNKINAELADFIDKLEHEDAKGVIDSAYELVIKRELACILTENGDIFDSWSVADQGRALKVPNLLDWFYTFWLKTDSDTCTPLIEFAKFTVSSRALPEATTSVFT